MNTAQAAPTADAPITAPDPLVIPVSLMKTIIVRDATTGRWIEREVEEDKAAGLEVVFDPSDDYETDPTNLDREWRESGRGRTMEYRWLNTNSKYSARERSQGYEPVDPASFRTSRYNATNVPGIGQCYVYGDVYLCEIPASLAEARRKANKDRYDREEAERKFNFTQSDRETELSSDGLAKILRRDPTDGSSGSQQWLDSPNPVDAEVNSYYSALDRSNAERERGLSLVRGR